MILLESKGRFLSNKIINEKLEAQLFSLFGFYVEVFINHQKGEVMQIEPLKGKQWLSFYSTGTLSVSPPNFN